MKKIRLFGNLIADLAAVNNNSRADEGSSLLSLTERIDTEFVWPKVDSSANEAILALQEKLVKGQATILEQTTLWLMSELKRLKYMEVYEVAYRETMEFLEGSGVADAIKPDIYADACDAMADFLCARTFFPEVLDLADLGLDSEPTVELESDIVS